MKTMKLKIEVSEQEKKIFFEVTEIAPHATNRKYACCSSEDFADITDSTFYLWNGTPDQSNHHTHIFPSVSALKSTLASMLKCLLEFDKKYAKYEDKEKLSSIIYNKGEMIEFDSEKQQEIVLFLKKETENRI